MSYFNKWIRGTAQSYDPRRNRSKSLDVESLEISGIRLVMQNVMISRVFIDKSGINCVLCVPFSGMRHINNNWWHRVSIGMGERY